MADTMNEAAARAAAMRRARDPGSDKAPGWDIADKIHALLPDWLSARTAVLKKKNRLQQLDRETQDEEGMPR